MCVCVCHERKVEHSGNQAGNNLYRDWKNVSRRTPWLGLLFGVMREETDGAVQL